MTTNFTLEVNEHEANVIAAALAKMPFEIVAPLISKLQEQVTRQLQSETAREQEATA